MEIHTEVHITRIRLTELESRSEYLTEKVHLAEAESFLLSSEIGTLHCKVDHLVAISRVGWWDKTVLGSLRRCNQSRRNEQ